MNKEVLKNGEMVGRGTRSLERKRMTKQEVEKMIAKMKDRDSELVTGIFKNLETPGGTAMFSYHIYPETENIGYELRDGERYQIPRGVARHLNNNCFYREYKHLRGEFGDTGIRAGFNDGRMRADNMQASRKVHRYAFHSLEFMDDDIELRAPANLLEVSVSP